MDLLWIVIVAVAGGLALAIDPFWGTLVSAGIGAASGGSSPKDERMDYWLTPEEAQKLKDLVYGTMEGATASPDEQETEADYLAAIQKMLGQTGGFSDDEMQEAYSMGARPIEQQANVQQQNLDRELALMGGNAGTSGMALDASRQIRAGEAGALSGLSGQIALENATRRSDYGLNKLGAAENYFARRASQRTGTMGTAGNFFAGADTNVENKVPKNTTFSGWKPQTTRKKDPDYLTALEKLTGRA